MEFKRLVQVMFPRAEVAVNAQVLVAEIAEVESKPEKPLKVDTFVETDESSTPSAVRAGGQPGFASNSGVGPASIGRPGGANAATRESERIQSAAKFPLTERRTDESANHPVKVAASVIIPRQEVTVLLREELGPDAEIGTPEIEARTALIQADLRKLLMPLVDSSGFRNGTSGEVEIAVMPYADWAPVATAGAGGALGGSLDVIAGGDLGSAIKNAGLVGLSLLSLAMMFLMVRRGGGAEALPTAEELAGVPPVLDDNDAQLVGEAEEAAPAMVGRAGRRGPSTQAEARTAEPVDQEGTVRGGFSPSTVDADGAVIDLRIRDPRGPRPVPLRVPESSPIMSIRPGQKLPNRSTSSMESPGVPSFCSSSSPTRPERSCELPTDAVEEVTACWHRWATCPWGWVRTSSRSSTTWRWPRVGREKVGSTTRSDC